ncbi:MAG: Hsp20/alpha crystallin family protein [Flavobacteriaceae bacterium]|nr:Hsp20/alpha crystallin family protein [Muriicola sp.]NNC61995.1 Hsp20/alpha crystallin family protein [Eudoraea sp.]NNK19673.1 Hsp20/alpha crystallin family protein [Flavobacteriaceae bacterium]MBT8290983.1 Hsp20/alpha crystallin family protein [Muriicola sp.]NNK36181.1 Hsp20/alpha crystallin family protein [Eudoraea sp.]
MSIITRNTGMLPSLMNEFFRPDWMGGSENYVATLPAVNIKEDDMGFNLELAIPGKDKKDFNVEVDKDVLTISMESKSENEKTEENYTRKEFSYSSFKRSFTMPDTVDSDKIKATYKEGILSLYLPKKEEALPKPKRMIEIGK